MLDSDAAAPSAIQILSHKASVTLVRFVFAAQQATLVNHVLLKLVLDVTVLNQAIKFLLIHRPIAFVLFILVQDVLRWGKNREMNVFNTQNGFQEEFEVVLFAEACELGNVIQADVDHSFDSRVSQASKELLRILVSKTYGANSHGVWT